MRINPGAARNSQEPRRTQDKALLSLYAGAKMSQKVPTMIIPEAIQ
jgi:hypothetical protein